MLLSSNLGDSATHPRRDRQNCIESNAARQIPKLRLDGSVDFFSRDLTELAKSGSLATFCGREKVIQQAITILCQDGKANVVFTGEPGVGKSAVVEGLAHRIVFGSVPESLQNVSIKELDTNALAVGTIYHGQFEERIKALVDFLLRHPSILLFMDELHSILSISSDMNRVSPFANYIKPYLARGEIRMIGTTTNSEYQTMNSRDSALTRRFFRIDVPEPNRDEAIVMLKQVALDQARKSGVIFKDGVLEAAVDLSTRFVQDRRLPDKAIDLLAGCIGKKTAQQLTEKASDKRASIPGMIDLVEREVRALENRDWGTASGLAAEWFTLKSVKFHLSKEDIHHFATERYGGIDSTDKFAIEKVLGLESELRSCVIGQERAIASVCSSLKRMMALGRTTRPVGSFLFLGPTGVGKTELCRLSARRLWGDDSLLQYNMSEYMERLDATKLIGASPGYVGYEEGGRLVRDVARKPSSVVLFDEIEKAHPDIHKLLLQILEEGRLQDGTGKICSFSQALVILTSNIAAEWVSQLSSADFAQRYDEIHGELLERLKREFRPEIVNRIDEVVIFAPWSEPT